MKNVWGAAVVIVLILAITGYNVWDTWTENALTLEMAMAGYAKQYVPTNWGAIRFQWVKVNNCK